MRYEVVYTKKDEESFSGYHSERFETWKQAEQWVKDNQDVVYWSSVRDTEAASERPRYIFRGEIPDDYDKIQGTLQTYFETGMECLGLVLQADEPKGPPNPKFNPLLPEGRDNFRNYSSYDALFFIENGDILEVDGVMYAMVQDRKFARADGYRFSFYPMGWSKKELVELFMPENKRAVIYRKKKPKEAA